jgi:hypothetical protein
LPRLFLPIRKDFARDVEGGSPSLSMALLLIDYRIAFGAINVPSSAYEFERTARAFS